MGDWDDCVEKDEQKNWGDQDDYSDNITEMTGVYDCNEQGDQDKWNEWDTRMTRLTRDTESMSFLVLPQHDCNFNLYPEGLSVFASFRFRHLRIWVG